MSGYSLFVGTVATTWYIMPLFMISSVYGSPFVITLSSVHKFLVASFHHLYPNGGLLSCSQSINGVCDSL